ncbi:DUF3775 domain-containing protein [Labrys sp. ZIDIC5]|uniref:DUF3775 domain-containing protein n=1 Tax=Labrys sedimenti TaxID=3106036 RepID=UPI002ACAADDC|nr:DUF3775 domain-containing protein [Labrys sp. ZIDIC5]MDZ5454475.1 DUF3775 domain-containing protein [Labrys sp. ZIDIC5]
MADYRDLSIPLETIDFIVTKARQYAAKDAVTEPSPASNPSDDGMLGVLEDHRDDPVRIELFNVIGDLNEDEKADLVALAWLGRGDSDVDGWGELRAEALRVRNERTATYLLGMPLLAEYLEEGLSSLGAS